MKAIGIEAAIFLYFFLFRMYFIVILTWKRTARYFPEGSHSIATIRPPTVTESSSLTSDVKRTSAKLIIGYATLISSNDDFVSKIFSWSGKEKIMGSSLDANINAKSGPKQAAAIRPDGTVHLSAYQGVGLPDRQTLNIKALRVHTFNDSNIHVRYETYNYPYWRHGTTNLKMFLHVAENKRPPQKDQRTKHNPPPPTRFRGMPSSLDTSHTIILESLGEQDTNISP